MEMHTKAKGNPTLSSTVSKSKRQYACILYGALRPMAYFTKEVNLGLAKRPLVFNGRLANRGLTPLVKEVSDHQGQEMIVEYEIFLLQLFCKNNASFH